MLNSQVLIKLSQENQSKKLKYHCYTLYKYLYKHGGPFKVLNTSQLLHLYIKNIVLLT